MSFSLVILILVLIGIAFRQLFPFRLKIWQIMGLGALCTLITGRISIPNAFQAIDWSVIVFLFGMFVLGRAFEESGYLMHIAEKMERAPQKKVLGSLIFSMGLLSAVLMNDTVAIMGTPVVVYLAHKMRLKLEPLLLALAFSLSIGSVMSPVGNPQNLLIAIKGGLDDPFLTFLQYLFLPTLLNLYLAYRFLAWKFKDLKDPEESKEISPQFYDAGLTRLCMVGFWILVGLIFGNIFCSILGLSWSLALPLIGVIPALVILSGSQNRVSIFRHVDWHTLIFFVAMFILMQSVYDSLSLGDLLTPMQNAMQKIPGVLVISAIISQIISNVPYVALMLPLFKANPTVLMSLAAGSTIAGNLLIFGAASNVIIVQKTEKLGRKSMRFFEFAKVGFPLSVLNLFVYWGFIYLSSKVF